MARVVVRTLRDAGAEIALAPERHLASRLAGDRGVLLASLVVERNERVAPRDLKSAIVFDTTHAKDGVLDVGAARASGAASSAKKRVHEGDLVVSRLRPYLRQIALVHPAAVAACEGRALVGSPEFYVLSGRRGADLAFLLPFLLGDEAQAALAAGQEGGHHPRVPLETLLALRVSRALVATRARTSGAVREALADLYAAQARYAAAIARRGDAANRPGGGRPRC